MGFVVTPPDHGDEGVSFRDLDTLVSHLWKNDRDLRLAGIAILPPNIAECKAALGGFQDVEIHAYTKVDMVYADLKRNALA